MSRTLLFLPLLFLAIATSCSRLGCEPSQERRDAARSGMHADEIPPLDSGIEDRWEVVDPYCGMRLRRDQAAATLVHRGQTFYFCMEDHRDAFARDPERYLAEMDASPEAPPEGGPASDSGP